MRRRLRENLEINYWPSLTDALFSVMLVMLFLIMLFVLTQMGLLEAIGTKESALSQLSTRLAMLEKQLGLSKKQSLQLQDDLANALAALDRMTLKSREAGQQLASMSATLSATTQALVSANARIEDIASRLSQTLARLSETSSRLTDTSSRLTETSSSLAGARGELGMAKSRLTEEEEKSRKLRTDISASAEQIQRLTAVISDYLKQIEALNEQLSTTKKNMEARDATLADLNATADKLSKQIAELNVKLGEAQKQAAEKKLEISKLMDLLEQRDKEIARLRDFEKYKSEFLARLSSVFGNAKNIRVIGDRFVFQGEVLFASGSAELTEAGKLELRKFVDTYKALEPRIPKSVNLNIQVQGHTDTDPISGGRYADNWELSVARAMRVMRYLILQGIPETRLSSAGYSQYHPVVMDDSPEAKAQNRRIEIMLTNK